MSKKLFCVIAILTLLYPFLFAQEVTLHKQGLKYDFRLLQEDALVHDFDVLHYDFDWRIIYDTLSIQGAAVIRARSQTESLGSITLHLDQAMTVTAVTQFRVPLVFTRLDDLLTIFLAQSFSTGEEFEIRITYNGQPQAGLNFSTHQDQPIIWSLDEPIGARNWFPCYDLPDDKATVEMRITVPETMIIASNGLLLGTSSNSDGTKTYVWQEAYPISTYLISVAATNYITYTDTYTSGTNAMPVTYFVYPEHFAQAQEDFSVTVPMIAFFAQVFGEYPFLSEKYGMAAIPWSGAMEHQTCTSYGSPLITGTHRYDWIVAHELAHQWWGDLVTLADWADIWLNEGFATYSDALWHEHLGGLEGLKSRMEVLKNIYLTQHQGQEHPIHNPPAGHLFCAIEYEKAACVLHMLRFVTGEENFLKILKTYAQDFAYANAATEDFRKVCESISGQDLGWFFEQWIYKSGYPTYQFGWGDTGQGTVRIIINQTQTDFPVFVMPVELHVILPAGELKKTLWVDKKDNVFAFAVPAKPVDVLFDPDGWLLCLKEKFVKKGKRRR